MIEANETTPAIGQKKMEKILKDKRALEIKKASDIKNNISLSMQNINEKIQYEFS